ncbi:thioredoxin-like protein [Mycolicibacterium chubuense NBB4]|uniref:Thioredoxin-like protein n=1 Tax=Mycolicibacterium chubuense (strain NBB4) TaxID=710421 RepID=I4BHY9_MYCCN|nr:NifU family protein [Mycolicibacterium chubuense]AFM16896.1 thioredoxin-like protein [Mycolicibacterium chubuense NBB4]
MAPTAARDDERWRTAGDRIQTLLDASAAGGTVARERAEQLVREITDLYGAALERMLGAAVTANPELAEDFAADGLVASLLLVHGLHPHTVEQRVSAALDGVRPYLGSHGGDVSLLGVADGVVSLRFQGSCRSCPSSAVTLELAVQDAIRAAAPEVSDIEVLAAETDSPAAVIPADALLSRVHAHTTTWCGVPELAGLSDAEVGGFRVAGMTVLACRVGAEVFAYHDRCPGCSGSLAGARLSGAVLRCPHCAAGYDVVLAGAGVDAGVADGHLEPIPLLERDGVLSMAVTPAVEVA